MQKRKFTQTGTFQIGKAVARNIAFATGVFIGMVVVEAAARRILK